MLHVGVISAYPADDWHAQRIASAAGKRAETSILRPSDFGAQLGRSACLTVAGKDARRYDLFLTPRAVGDDGDPELQLELYRTLAEMGSLVVNPIAALLWALDKFKSSWLFAKAGLPTPPTVVTQQVAEAAAALARFGRMVKKPLYGSLGVGIELLGPADAPRLGELLARERALYLQAYIEGETTDVRAFVVGDRVEAAIARAAMPGELRANLHQGARALPFSADAGVVDLAVRATRAVGLDYAGVDILVGSAGPTVLEVNGTPAFRGIFEATGRDMAPAIVRHALARARQIQFGDGESEWRRDRRAT